MENWFIVYSSEVSLTKCLNLMIAYPYGSFIDASNSFFLNASDKAILFALATELQNFFTGFISRQCIWCR